MLCRRSEGVGGMKGGRGGRWLKIPLGILENALIPHPEILSSAVYKAGHVCKSKFFAAKTKRIITGGSILYSIEYFKMVSL